MVDCAIAIFLKLGGSDASIPGIGIGITVEVAQLSGNLPDNQVLFKVPEECLVLHWGGVFKHLIVNISRTDSRDFRCGDGVR